MKNWLTQRQTSERSRRLDAMIAHGSGTDEVILFLAIPAVYWIYRLIRSQWAKAHGRVWPERREPPAEDGQGEDPQ